MPCRFQKKKGLLQAPSKNKKISLGGPGGIVGPRTSLRKPEISFGASNSSSKNDCVYWGVHTGIAKEFTQGVFEKYAPASGNVWASAGKIVVVVD